MTSLFSFDNKIRKKTNLYIIAGVDEAGRGPLAGPVVSAAVILPPDLIIEGIKDSKLLTEDQREELFNKICSSAIAYGIGIVNNKVIDKINIFNATYKAMRIAVRKLSIRPDLILVDGPFEIPKIHIPQKPIISGDRKSASIVCASILAKVTRDRIMYKYDKIYPQYGFCRNKGYATIEHRIALKNYGTVEIHRQSFKTKFL
ncbi:MAG: ribonuclease HII [Endomicrobiia bacterium]